MRKPGSSEAGWGRGRAVCCDLVRTDQIISTVTESNKFHLSQPETKDVC